MTPAGKLLLAVAPLSVRPLYAVRVANIEAEAAAAEADHWRCLPGTYRTEDGGLEVVVDVPESASYVKDEFPDEVALIQTAAVAARNAEIAEAVRGLEGQCHAFTGLGCDSFPCEVNVSRAAVLAIVERP